MVSNCSGSGVGDEDYMMSEEELSCWLVFSQMKGLRINDDQFRDIIDRYENLINLFEASKDELLASRLFKPEIVRSFLDQKSKADPEQMLKDLERSETRAIPFSHVLYPPKLRHIHHPPLVLYMKGKLQPEDFHASIGIVGTRQPTAYGKKLAKDFSRDLARAGATIVSGMAVGIDSLAHWGALEASGKTVAVLASGVDYCYPSANRPLYDKLIEEEVGAVVSEYFPGVKPDKWRFPARNRIVAGMSDGLLVVEAGESSGALITANLAFNQSRAVFAIPGRIDSRMSKGTNSIISRDMAKLVSSPEEIMDEMNWVSAKMERKVPTVVELFGREKEVFDMLSNEPLHFDYLCQEMEMGAGELSGTLTMLELAGVVERLPGDWFSRIDN